MKLKILCVLIVGALGCESRPQELNWKIHKLTEAQDARQEKLLVAIVQLIKGPGDLEGVPASEHDELFSLADKTANSGENTFYGYEVISSGDSHVLGTMIIAVTNEKIRFATWPFAER